jgi:hypothetical protein
VTYKVLVAESVEKSLKSHPLLQPACPEIFRRLINDLASNPNALLGEVIVPLAIRAYRIAVDNYELVFAVEPLNYEKTGELHVVDWKFGDPGSGLPQLRDDEPFTEVRH